MAALADIPVGSHIHGIEMKFDENSMRIEYFSPKGDGDRQAGVVELTDAREIAVVQHFAGKNSTKPWPGAEAAIADEEKHGVVWIEQIDFRNLNRHAEPKGPPEGFEEIRLPNNRGPEIEFLGKLMAEHTTQNKQRNKQRWQEIRLWETPVGNWIVESVGCSDDDGHVDITNLGIFQIDEVDRELAAMDFLDWGYAARALAKKMGWNLVRRIA